MKVFKKILFIMLIISTVSFSISLEEYRSDNNVNTIEISQGWNLVSFYEIKTLFNQNCFNQNDLRNTFFLSGEEYKSLSEFGKYSNEFVHDVNFGHSFVNKAFWHRSNIETDCTYSLSDFNGKYKQDLTTGWDSIAIAPQMIGSKIEDVFGSCDIKKSYGFENRQWKELEFDNNYVIKESDVSKPLFIKVDDACNIDVGEEINNHIFKLKIGNQKEFTYDDKNFKIRIYAVNPDDLSLELTDEERNIYDIRIGNENYYERIGIPIRDSERLGMFFAKLVDIKYGHQNNIEASIEIGIENK